MCIRDRCSSDFTLACLCNSDNVYNTSFGHRLRVRVYWRDSAHVYPRDSSTSCSLLQGERIDSWPAAGWQACKNPLSKILHGMWVGSICHFKSPLYKVSARFLQWKFIALYWLMDVTDQGFYLALAILRLHWEFNITASSWERNSLSNSTISLVADQGILSVGMS